MLVSRHLFHKRPRNGEYAPLPIQRSFGLAIAMWFSSEIGVRCWQLPQAQQQGHECGNGWPGLWGLTMPDHLVQAGNFLTLGQHGTTRQHAKKTIRQYKNRFLASRRAHFGMSTDGFGMSTSRFLVFQFTILPVPATFW